MLTCHLRRPGTKWVKLIGRLWNQMKCLIEKLGISNSYKHNLTLVVPLHPHFARKQTHITEHLCHNEMPITNIWQANCLAINGKNNKRNIHNYPFSAMKSDKLFSSEFPPLHWSKNGKEKYKEYILHQKRKRNPQANF